MLRRRAVLFVPALPLLCSAQRLWSAPIQDHIKSESGRPVNQQHRDDLFTLETCVRQCRIILQQNAVSPSSVEPGLAECCNETLQLCSRVRELIRHSPTEGPAVCQSCADACARCIRRCRVTSPEFFAEAAAVCCRYAGKV